MEQALSAAGLPLHNYRAVADLVNSRYTFLVEVDGTCPTEASLSSLLDALDAHLNELNLEYAQKRESRRLRAPVLWVMKPGWFERKASSMLKHTDRDIQFKPQILSAAPEDSSEALLIIEKTDDSASSGEPA